MSFSLCRCVSAARGGEHGRDREAPKEPIRQILAEYRVRTVDEDEIPEFAQEVEQAAHA